MRMARNLAGRREIDDEERHFLQKFLGKYLSGHTQPTRYSGYDFSGT